MVANKNYIKAILMWLCSLSVMCTGIVSPASPIIKKSFEHVHDIGFVVKMMIVVPNFFIAIFSPIFGYLAIRVGKLKLLKIAIVVYSISGIAGKFLPDIYQIIFARALLGISIAAIMTVATTLIADYFDGYERSSLVGLQTTMMSIGSTVYSLLGGAIADVNWRNIFILYFLAGVIIFPFVAIFLFEPKSGHEHFSQNKADRKIVQNNFVIFLVCCINLTTMTMYYMLPTQLPFLLMTNPLFSEGMNAKKTALVFSLQVLVTAIVSLRYRRLKKNRDFAVMCAMGFAFMALGFIIISKAINYYMICLGTMTLGIGTGLMMPNSTLWIISITKPNKRSFFIGLFHTSTFLGKFLSPIFAIPIISLSGGLQNAFLTDAFIMLFIGIIAMYFNDYFKRVNRILFRKELQKLKSNELLLEVEENL